MPLYYHWKNQTTKLGQYQDYLFKKHILICYKPLQKNFWGPIQAELTQFWTLRAQPDPKTRKKIILNQKTVIFWFSLTGPTSWMKDKSQLKASSFATEKIQLENQVNCLCVQYTYNILEIKPCGLKFKNSRCLFLEL